MSIAVFRFEPNGSPNIADWPAGSVPVYVYAKGDGLVGGHTYAMIPRLFRGQAGSNYNTPYDTGTLETPPAGLAQDISGTWTLYTFSVPVQALSGPTSDRLLLQIQVARDDGGDGGGVEFIHIGSDGGSNQTKVEPPFFDPPAVPAALERNPDAARPAEVVEATLAAGVPQTLGTFDSHVGDPGLIVWAVRIWRFRIWAKAVSGTTVLTADLRRKPTGGSGGLLAEDVAIGTVTSTSWMLFRANVSIPESVGDSFGASDVIRSVLKASSAAGAVVQISVGLDYPSSLNAPLLPPSGVSVVAPSDDGKVMTESGSPRRYLRDAVQSTDGSIALTIESSSQRLVIEMSGSGYVRPNCSTTVGAGWLFLPIGEHGHSDHVDWTATGDFYGINKKWGDGLAITDRKEAMVYINNATPANPITVRDGATPPSSDWLPLALSAVAGASQDLEFSGPTALWFWLNLAENRWCLKSYQTYTVVP